MSCLERRMTDESRPRPWHSASVDSPQPALRWLPVRSGTPPDVPAAEWNVLFQAVISRLNGLTGALALLAGGGQHEALHECILALEQLRNSAAAFQTQGRSDRRD